MWEPNAADRKKVEVIWNEFFRKGSKMDMGQVKKAEEKVGK